MPTHHKLVRDLIPEIITRKGETCVTHIASEGEYWNALKAKLQEEVNEFQAETNIVEELADVLEVVTAICAFKGIDLEELERVQTKKREERGGFAKRIILETTN